MLAIELVVGGLVGGFTFWLRGSSLFQRLVGRGKTTADALWALAMGGLYVMAGAEWYGGAAVALGCFAGARPGWWQSLSLGRNSADGAEGLQYLRHWARGMVWVSGAALGVWLTGGSPVPLAVAGMLCVPAYVVGYAWREDHDDPYTNPTAVAEFLFGMTIGVGVVLSWYVSWGVSLWPL